MSARAWKGRAGASPGVLGGEAGGERGAGSAEPRAVAAEGVGGEGGVGVGDLGGVGGGGGGVRGGGGCEGGDGGGLGGGGGAVFGGVIGLFDREGASGKDERQRQGQTRMSAPPSNASDGS